MSEREKKIAEIEEKIEKIKKNMFYEACAEFIDWSYYSDLKEKLYACECELKALSA